MKRFRLTYIFFTTVCLLLAGCEENTASKSASQACFLQDATVRAQAEASKISVQASVEAQKRMLTIQMGVIQACIASKGLPVMISGNVDCKPLPGK